MSTATGRAVPGSGISPDDGPGAEGGGASEQGLAGEVQREVGDDADADDGDPSESGGHPEPQPQDSSTVMYQPERIAGPTTNVAVPDSSDCA